MSSNIFDQLDNDSEGDDFFEVINKPQQTTPYGKIESAETSENKNIFDVLNDQQKEEKSFSFLDTVKDVGKQIASKGVSGALGAYGNITGMFGQTKENLLPGQEARLQNNDEFDLGLDDDILPSYSRLPSTKDVSNTIQELTGVGEGQTPAGRIAGRGAEFGGEALAFPGTGAKGLLSVVGAGLAGQGLREAGANETIATGTEIAGSVIPSLIQGKVMPTRKEAKGIANAGRSIGLTEKQITPLIQSEGKVSLLSKVARKGESTKQLFQSIKDSLGDSYQTIKQNVSNLGNVNNANRQILENKFTAIRNDLSKTVKASPDKKAAIEFIDDAISKIQTSSATPEELINFWQDINKSVKWNSLQGGKKSLAQLKEPILEVLNNVAPSAAKDFEMTNQLYSKYSQISKKLKPDLVDAFINKAEIMGAVPAVGYAIVHGNVSPLLGLASESAVRLIGREMLTNPYFQNIANKLVTNFNQGSLKGLEITMKNVNEYMKRKHPEENWDFLISENNP